MNEHTYLLENEIQDRERDIDNIHDQLLDIHSIFQMLNNTVHDQGYLIDHIESNVTQTVVNVENADIELVLADKKSEKTNNCLWIIVIILVFLLLVFIIVF